MSGWPLPKSHVRAHAIAAATRRATRRRPTAGDSLESRVRRMPRFACEPARRLASSTWDSAARWSSRPRGSCSGRSTRRCSSLRTSPFAPRRTSSGPLSPGSLVSRAVGRRSSIGRDWNSARCLPQRRDARDVRLQSAWRRCPTARARAVADRTRPIGVDSISARAGPCEEERRGRRQGAQFAKLSVPRSAAGSGGPRASASVRAFDARGGVLRAARPGRRNQRPARMGRLLYGAPA